ncbi:MAG: cytochrome c oxidase subunit II [Gemmatimonadetes bacterium]|nr:cytochrome c oxidase subunit II [Gemmatimonadota bacterium]
MNWMFPQSVSTFGPEIDRLYYIILAITGVVFVLTEVLLFYFLIRYRAREGHKAEYNHGNTKAEVIWTTVPFVIVVGLALMSVGVWKRIKDPSAFPPNAYQIIVTARQFEWEATYPGADGQLRTADDFKLLNRLNVPVNRPFVVNLESSDVIHSFFVYPFRVKQDVVPGMTIPVWFEVTATGEYALGCAELCGFGHYSMDGTVMVQTQTEFQAWEATQIAARAAAGVANLAAAGATGAPAN